MKKNLSGIIFCLFFSIIFYFICKLGFCEKINLNSLTLAIIIGMVFGNLLMKFIPRKLRYGIKFSGKKILRLGIILYGFRITFQQIIQVGFDGFFVDIIMLTTTYLIGYYVGTRLFKLDKDLCMLTSIGSSICGAAAILGTDSMLKAKSHKVSLAVSTVVLFGTIAMFLYPVLYNIGILPSNVFGIYIGATVHEVAQVVAAGSAISSNITDTAVIVKLTRVMMLVPYLFFLGLYLKKKSQTQTTKIPIPWFAVLFVIMCIVNSTNLIPRYITDRIIELDIILLTMAMFALGIETNFEKIKGLGIKPILVSLIMFIWLVVGGFLTIKVITKF